MGFVLAFRFSIVEARFAGRRAMVLQEANAIGIDARELLKVMGTRVHRARESRARSGPVARGRGGVVGPHPQRRRHAVPQAGLLLFGEDALAEGVTLQKATYQVLAVDAGLKFRGLTLQSEYFLRRLSDFLATGPVPMDSLLDHGFTVQAMYMVWPKRLGVYGSGTAVFDDFERRPWELVGGVSAYPFQSQSLRLNLHVIHVERSPTGSNFGFYAAGQTGTTVSLGVDILL